MSKSIVNLTIPFVNAEIEQVLATYPSHPCRQIFANPDLRQELIAYILTRIHSVYVAVDAGKKIESDMEATSITTETQSCVKSLIHQGIHHTLQQHQELASLQVPEESDGYLLASHWFG